MGLLVTLRENLGESGPCFSGSWWFAVVVGFWPSSLGFLLLPSMSKISLSPKSANHTEKKKNPQLRYLSLKFQSLHFGDGGHNLTISSHGTQTETKLSGILWYRLCESTLSTKVEKGEVGRSGGSKQLTYGIFIIHPSAIKKKSISRDSKLSI